MKIGRFAGIVDTKCVRVLHQRNSHRATAPWLAQTQRRVGLPFCVHMYGLRVGAMDCRVYLHPDAQPCRNMTRNRSTRNADIGIDSLAAQVAEN
jgi:hypothetical protein